jgi:bifunctional enzyme CysN/CysC
MIVDAVEGSDDLAQAVTAEERAARFGQQAASLYFTGETKQAQAIALERRLFSMGHATALLTPDSLGDNADEKLGEKLTQAINQAGLIALCTFDAPVDAFVVSADTSTDDVVAQLQSKGII